MNDGQGGAPAIRPPGDERGSTPCRLGHLSAVPAPAGFPAPGRGVPGIFTPPKAECQTKYKHGPRTEECPVAVCSVRLGRCVPADDRLRGAGTWELPEGAGGGLGPLELPTFADQPLPWTRVEGRLRPALPQRRGWRSRLLAPHRVSLAKRLSLLQHGRLHLSCGVLVFFSVALRFSSQIRLLKDVR